jgi:hypothetical protein
MQSLAAVCFVGLCLLASCVYAQTIPPRGQYRVGFKIAGGKLAIDRDSFDVAPAFVKLESAIRFIIRRAIAKIGPLSASLLIDSAWPDYTVAFQNWSEANPDQLDLGTLFSSDFLFADLLAQTPDLGLVLNDEEIDPASGTISFSILPLFDSRTVRIDLPALLPSRQATRTPELRQRLAKLNGALWSSTNVRQALAPLYSNLGLTPAILLLPRNQAIQIDEGPRIASILLPSDQVAAGDIDRVLWNLLGTGQFRRARGKRVVDFDRDLGYAAGDEPYAIQYQIQAMQLLISPLGYSLTTQASTRTGASQYVDLRVESVTQAKTKNKLRHIAGGFVYKPGQGLSAIGNLQLPPLNLSAGGPSGTLGSGSYSASYLGLSASVGAGVSLERNRVLDGVKVNEQSTTESATLGWTAWRGMDGNTVLLQLVPSHELVLGDSLNTIQPGLQFVHNDLTSQYPWRVSASPSILIDKRFTDCILTANTHRAFDNWEYDLSGRFENAAGHPPIFELPSFGGADTVRGFRADDAIGRTLWATQPELWLPIPRFPALKLATFIDLGGAYQTIGSYPGLRAGPGIGLRLDLRVAVLKLDWAYGLGQAATGGSRGKFYFNVVLPTH